MDLYADVHSFTEYIFNETYLAHNRMVYVYM